MQMMHDYKFMEKFCTKCPESIDPAMKNMVWPMMGWAKFRSKEERQALYVCPIGVDPDMTGGTAETRIENFTSSQNMFVERLWPRATTKNTEYMQRAGTARRRAMRRHGTAAYPTRRERPEILDAQRSIKGHSMMHSHSHPLPLPQRQTCQNARRAGRGRHTGT